MAACFVSAHSSMDTPHVLGDTIHGVRNCNVWLSENRRSGAIDHKKNEKEEEHDRTRKAPWPGALDSAVVLPPVRVQNILRSLRIRALACVAKDVTNICLAERKLEVWGK